MVRLLVAAMLIVAVAIPGGEASAQQARWFELMVDNDALIGFLPGRDPSDKEYTHGMWLALEESGASFWSGLLPGTAPCPGGGTGDGSCALTRFEGGLKMYTPDFRSAVPDSVQRPYAGWLYGAVTGRIAKQGIERSVRVELGVTGRPTMAEYLQRAIHEIAHYTISDGWSDQLAFEPGVLVRYRESRVLELSDGDMRIADLIPTWQASLGNVHTGLMGGVMARAGYRVPHPWLAGGPADRLAAYIFAGYRRYWTMHDLFLDGNTFRDGPPSVEKRPFTDEIEIGAAVEARRVRLTASVIRQDRLYETQIEPQLYARTGISYTP